MAHIAIYEWLWFMFLRIMLPRQHDEDEAYAHTQNKTHTHDGYLCKYNTTSIQNMLKKCIWLHRIVGVLCTHGSCVHLIGNACCYKSTLQSRDPGMHISPKSCQAVHSISIVSYNNGHVTSVQCVPTYVQFFLHVVWVFMWLLLQQWYAPVDTCCACVCASVSASFVRLARVGTLKFATGWNEHASRASASNIRIRTGTQIMIIIIRGLNTVACRWQYELYAPGFFLLLLLCCLFERTQRFSMDLHT